jgi:membrane-bound metal-dependent hydrolase YbcI (DUF457 family)
MTTFEHAMLGVNGALACGLQHRFGWRVAAFAGLAAITPDWDGLTIVGGMRLFDQAHRAWGHSFAACLLMAALLVAVDIRLDLMGWGRRTLERLMGSKDKVIDPRPEASPLRCTVWFTVAVLAMLSHFAADLVYSGAEGLSDWELKLLWPFSQAGFVYPLVRWGDVGVTLIFVAGMFAMLRWRPQVQPIAGVTIACTILYIVGRGALNATL